MATRSLTEIFILMRNNAAQSRHIYSEQVSKRVNSNICKVNVNDRVPVSPTDSFDSSAIADDRMALVHGGDIEMGGPAARANRLPPEWVDGVEEIQYEVTRIKDKLKELSLLHDKHLNRPTMDDSIDEEHAIEITTQELTQMFMRCQRLIQQIGARSRDASSQEKLVTKNVMQSLATVLTELSTNFRKGQSSYLRKLKSREEHHKHFFDTGIPSGSLMEEEFHITEDMYDKGFSQDQMLMVEDNTQMVQQREEQIAQVVRSIADLNLIFKDLSGMVVDQGTILDRIDYNVEQTSTRIGEGLKQLQKAESYQKKNRKMYCIFGMFIATVVMIIILIAVKS